MSLGPIDRSDRLLYSFHNLASLPGHNSAGLSGRRLVLGCF